MAVQYPHILIVENPTSEPVLVSGEWVFGKTDPVNHKCRAEANNSNSSVSTESGEAVYFEYTVYLPKMEAEYNEGTECVLKLSETKEIETTIKRHFNGQFNSRIWL